MFVASHLARWFEGDKHWMAAGQTAVRYQAVDVFVDVLLLLRLTRCRLFWAVGWPPSVPQC
jgi:hypothetical protein